MIKPIENMNGAFSLKGMNAVITGGNRGLGLGIATAMAQSGANIAILCRDKAKAAEALAERLAGLTVKIKCAAGADGRLYGAVTAKDIAELMEKEFGIKLDKRKITMNEQIRTHGVFPVEVRLYTDIVGKFSIVVHE